MKMFIDKDMYRLNLILDFSIDFGFTEDIQ